MSLVQNTTTPLWANFVDLDNDVKPWLQFPSTDTTADIQLQMVIDGICQWFQQALNKPIAPMEYDFRFDGWSGWNGAYLMLPYYPVLEITSVTEYWGVSGPHVLYEQTPTNQVDGFQCTYRTGMLTRVFPGLVQKPWFPGSRNIEVQWTAGYNPIPGDIKLAALQDIADFWHSTQQTQRSAFQPAGTGGAEQGAQGTPWAGLAPRLRSMLSDRQSVGIG